jgi:hypothetical protein
MRRRRSIGFGRAFGLQPHRLESFKLSKDPLFVEKVRDIVGLYLAAPERALVLCVDEKSQIQALDRTQLLLPMRPGQAERRSHDYARHGTLSLFAALDVAKGKVIGKCFARNRGQRPDRSRRPSDDYEQLCYSPNPGDPPMAGKAPPLVCPLHAQFGILDQPSLAVLRRAD